MAYANQRLPNILKCMKDWGRVSKSFLEGTAENQLDRIFEGLSGYMDSDKLELLKKVFALLDKEKLREFLATDASKKCRFHPLDDNIDKIDFWCVLFETYPDLLNYSEFAHLFHAYESDYYSRRDLRIFGEFSLLSIARLNSKAIFEDAALNGTDYQMDRWIFLNFMDEHFSSLPVESLNVEQRVRLLSLCQYDKRLHAVAEKVWTPEVGLYIALNRPNNENLEAELQRLGFQKRLSYTARDVNDAISVFRVLDAKFSPCYYDFCRKLVTPEFVAKLFEDKEDRLLITIAGRYDLVDLIVSQPSKDLDEFLMRVCTYDEDWSARVIEALNPEQTAGLLEFALTKNEPKLLALLCLYGKEEVVAAAHRADGFAALSRVAGLAWTSRPAQNPAVAVAADR